MTFDEMCKLLEILSKMNVTHFQYSGMEVIFDKERKHTPVKEVEEPKRMAPLESSFIKAEDILRSPAHLDNLSKEEILFAATPYFDELQAKKALHEEKLKEQV